MTKNDLNILFRNHIKINLSPKQEEQDLISKIYESVQKVLQYNCIQIGSYPRSTAISPVHDLDILYILGGFDPTTVNPRDVLLDLNNEIENNLENATPYSANILLQSHSISVVFTDSDEREIISIDIVPAFISGNKNEFGEDQYWVPELINVGHIKRKEYYEKVGLTKSNEKDWWIKTDPRGYIHIASDLNTINSDFRKTVKFIKKWKSNLEDKDSHLALKSFHIEQVITRLFQANSNIEIFDAIFNFFVSLTDIIDNPNTISDRANNDKFIDDYLQQFTNDQKLKIQQARDGFLIKLEEFNGSNSIKDLLDIIFYERKSLEESFLFDKKIPVLKEQALTINGWIQKNNQDFRRLSQQGIIDKGLKIRFKVFMPINCSYYKWKVKNDNSSIKPRGEITDHHTLSDPENTQYRGSHYVECYAILNEICIASARQNIVILN